ncbi:hypothetical protein GJ744_005920 [Endocarpon pusillum]|uniref:Tryptophan synthase beta chain-like PALP domain-containing protein n=1 Tax=Endocarpon pusillum TaxID=364733 RepID=A0A8H7E727_9EURO|nr:hypothetical protein GJ744_005920 [Endocarpon pusillum]
MSRPPDQSSTPSPNSPPIPSFSNLPITPQNIRLAHSLISPYIHRTPLLTCQTLTTLASTAIPRSHPTGDVIAGAATPKINLFFKCENYQKIGAFKARGAYHAVLRLIERDGLEEARKRGVVSHSSGNHAQALSLSSSTFKIPAYIVMPSISTPSKIAATRALTDHVLFSGSTSQEREEKVQEVMGRTGAVLVPPYDHADVVLGQGTVAVEMEGQFAGRREGQVCAVHHVHDHGLDDEGGGVGQQGVEGEGDASDGGGGGGGGGGNNRFVRPAKQFHVIVAPCGGGGLLSGIASYFYDDDYDDDEEEKDDEKKRKKKKKNSSDDSDAAAAASVRLRSSSPNGSFQSTKKKKKKKKRRRRRPYIIGAEPSFQDADDARRSLASHPPARIPHVKSLTIADGLRTPLGPNVTWPVISHGHDEEEREQQRVDAWSRAPGLEAGEEGGGGIGRLLDLMVRKEKGK